MGKLLLCRFWPAPWLIWEPNIRSISWIQRPSLHNNFMGLSLKFQMIGPQVFSLLYGKSRIKDLINSTLGLFVMVQLMLSGLKIWILSWMIIRFWPWLTEKEFLWLKTVNWCSRWKIWTTPLPLPSLDAVLSIFPILIWDMNQFWNPGSREETPIWIEEKSMKRSIIYSPNIS